MPLSELTLRRQVEQFYDRIRADELLAPIFAEHVKDWDTHVDRPTLARRSARLCLFTLDNTRGDYDCPIWPRRSKLPSPS